MVHDSAEPQTKIGLQCTDPYDCAFKEHCWKDIPENSVFDLTGVWGKTKFELYNKGIVRISDIPEGEKISRSKPTQIQATKAGKPIVDTKGLKSFLNEISYPISYLDFETFNPAIPKFKGTRPYQHIPFQFSVHKIEKPDGKLTHVPFLCIDNRDPRRELADSLLASLGNRGTIVAYHASFEKTVIKALAIEYPSIKNELEALLERFVDLEDVFKTLYFDPRFKGSTSIKHVLPVLVPTMSYKGLAVSNGSLAQIAYQKAAFGNVSAQEKRDIEKNLLEYCGQDTLAMVELHRYIGNP